MPEDYRYVIEDVVWLEDRKKLRKDWYDYLKAGEEKIKALLKDREWTINYPALH